MQFTTASISELLRKEMVKGSANHKNEVVIKHATKMNKPMHLTQSQPHNNNVTKIYKS